MKALLQGRDSALRQQFSKMAVGKELFIWNNNHISTCDWTDNETNGLETVINLRQINLSGDDTVFLHCPCSTELCIISFIRLPPSPCHPCSTTTLPKLHWFPAGWKTHNGFSYHSPWCPKPNKALLSLSFLTTFAVFLSQLCSVSVWLFCHAKQQSLHDKIS